MGDVPPGISASQRVDIPGRVIDGVQNGHVAPITDPDLDQGATAPLWMVMPDIGKAGHADDRVTNITSVKPVFRR
jgi:hypothetical protein